MSTDLTSIKPVLPGSTVGILGSGQLGRMLAFVAKRMGYTVVVFSDQQDSPAGQVADLELVGSYNDEALLRKFGEACDVITYEFENIPSNSCRILEEFAPVRPNPEAIFLTQNRARERELLTGLGIPVAPYHHIAEEKDIASLPADFTFPAILKAASFGYDGKGQQAVSSRADLDESWNALGQVECVLEERLQFAKEFSIVVARAVDGSIVTYGPIENHHEKHILDLSFYPSEIAAEVSELASDYAKQIAEKLGVLGVITIEFFLMKNNSPIVNEIAPRPHNSGHLTIEGFRASQFEQQLRGVCGLPLGSVESLTPVAMVNLLGELWNDDGDLTTAHVFQHPKAFLHLYGKTEPRSGRKMGHLTVVASDLTEAKSTALQLRDAMSCARS
ncbi:MAG: 5-(carboxyamino)imidazole ribonucleotide synthase [Bdellovibrionales bacterium]|nr:5-(carboxyamino)imidazole ribonucleotide synthase [Bdellovibrionales bacterium]